MDDKYYIAAVFIQTTAIQKIFGRFGVNSKTIFLVILGVVLVQYAIHRCLKQENYFEVFEISRIFTDAEKERVLKMKDSLDNILVDPQYAYPSVRFAKKLVSTPGIKIAYDKFKKIGENYSVYKDSSYLYFIGIDLIGKNVIFICIEILLNMDRKRKNTMKTILVTNILFLVFQIIIFQKDTEVKDLFDYLLPRYTIFDRIELFRMILFLINYIFVFVQRSKASLVDVVLIKLFSLTKQINHEASPDQTQETRQPGQPTQSQQTLQKGQVGQSEEGSNEQLSESQEETSRPDLTENPVFSLLKKFYASFEPLVTNDLNNQFKKIIQEDQISLNR